MFTRIVVGVDCREARTAHAQAAARLQTHARRALGAEHLAPACTTHFSVVDLEGNMAAVTQTLLSTFGSKYLLPQSGVTVNAGEIMHRLAGEKIHQ